MRFYFTDSMTYEKPEPHHTLCLQVADVTLQQRGRNHFLVRYGKQVDAELDYAMATERLGMALMHQAACNGTLENRMPGEL